jgi:hypothetical protein
MDEPGVVVIPRLTRHEYRNILRDLTGGIVLNAGQYLPNEGGAGEGFSNVGAAQGMGVAQFEKYLEAAKGALSHLRVSPHDGLVWSTVPREPVHDSKATIAEAVEILKVSVPEPPVPQVSTRLRLSAISTFVTSSHMTVTAPSSSVSQTPLSCRATRKAAICASVICPVMMPRISAVMSSVCRSWRCVSCRIAILMSMGLPVLVSSQRCPASRKFFNNR